MPARGGSKGIPGKNLKFLDGRPLIAYILDKLLGVEIIDQIVVTSDDEMILDFCASYYPKIFCIRRPSELAKDNVTLDPVIYHAYQELSKLDHFNYIFTFQPTSPLLKKQTIEKAINKLINSNSDTLITVTDSRHLYWTLKKGKYKPIYKKRLNRQQLPPYFKETGAILGCSDTVISNQSRIGKRISLLEVSKEESIDIDDYIDWVLVENLIQQPNFGIVVRANKEIGMGHVYRMLIIAYAVNTKVNFFIPYKDTLAIQKIKESFYKLTTIYWGLLKPKSSILHITANFYAGFFPPQPQ